MVGTRSKKNYHTEGLGKVIYSVKCSKIMTLKRRHYTVETYVILQTNVTPINLIIIKKEREALNMKFIYPFSVVSKELCGRERDTDCNKFGSKCELK